MHKVTEKGWSSYWRSIDATIQFNIQKRSEFLSKQKRRGDTQVQQQMTLKNTARPIARDYGNHSFDTYVTARDSDARRPRHDDRDPFPILFKRRKMNFCTAERFNSFTLPKVKAAYYRN